MQIHKLLLCLYLNFYQSAAIAVMLIQQPPRLHLFHHSECNCIHAEKIWPATQSGQFYRQFPCLFSDHCYCIHGYTCTCAYIHLYLYLSSVSTCTCTCLYHTCTCIPGKQCNPGNSIDNSHVFSLTTATAYIDIPTFIYLYLATWVEIIFQNM